MLQAQRVLLVLFLICLSVVSVPMLAPSLVDAVIRGTMWVGVIVFGMMFVLVGEED